MEHEQGCCLSALIVGLLCIGMMFGANASAEDKNACTDDISKFCKNALPGHGSIMECLEKHENELADAYKEDKRKTN